MAYPQPPIKDDIIYEQPLNFAISFGWIINFEAVPHSNSNWPDISQMARQIKNLKPLYEVKLLILLTWANF